MSANETAKKASETMGRLDKLFADNEQKISQTIAAIAATSKSASATVARVDRLIADNENEHQRGYCTVMAMTTKNAETFSTILDKQGKLISSPSSIMCESMSEQFKGVADQA